MKLNTHGLIGVLAILGMIGVAFLKHWNINWFYFGLAIIVYSILVLTLTIVGTDKYFYPTLFLVGCHIALILLSIGMLLVSPDVTETIATFVICVSVGLAIPRLLLWKQGGKVSVNRHGVPGILSLFIAFCVGLLFSRAPWPFFAAAIITYSLPLVFWAWSNWRDYGYYERNRKWYDDKTDEDEPWDTNSIRMMWGWHLGLVFLAGGMLVDTGQVSLSIELTYSIIFFTGIAAGLAIPFLLLRD